MEYAKNARHLSSAIIGLVWLVLIEEKLFLRLTNTESLGNFFSQMCTWKRESSAAETLIFVQKLEKLLD